MTEFAEFEASSLIGVVPLSTANTDWPAIALRELGALQSATTTGVVLTVHDPLMSAHEILRMATPLLREAMPFVSMICSDGEDIAGLHSFPKDCLGITLRQSLIGFDANDAFTIWRGRIGWLAAPAASFDLRQTLARMLRFPSVPTHKRAVHLLLNEAPNVIVLEAVMEAAEAACATLGLDADIWCTASAPLNENDATTCSLRIVLF